MSHEENNMFRLEWPPEPPSSLHRAELNLIVKPFTIHFDFTHSHGRQLFSVKSSDKPHCTLPAQYQTPCCSKVGFFSCIVTNVRGIVREVFPLLEQNPKGKQEIWPVVFFYFTKKKNPKDLTAFVSIMLWFCPWNPLSISTHGHLVRSHWRRLLPEVPEADIFSMFHLQTHRQTEPLEIVKR